MSTSSTMNNNNSINNVDDNDANDNNDDVHSDNDEYLSTDENDDNASIDNFADATQELVDDDDDDDDDEWDDASDDEDDDDDDDDDDSDDGDVDAVLPAASSTTTSIIPSITSAISNLIGTAVVSAMNGRKNESTQVERRRLIQQIMADRTLTEHEKRIRIQQLMMNVQPHVTTNTVDNDNEDDQPMTATTSISDVVATAGNACSHYARNCVIVAPCCQKIFGCRICHDEVTNANGEHQQMNRFALAEIICKQCNTRQSSDTNTCRSCSIQFGEYYCSICKLWMPLTKIPFHCADCGFCRVGGSESFRHCMECCMCVAISTYTTHHCIRDKYKNNCPVCHEDMFSSRLSPQELQCGHAIHSHCYRQLIKYDYRCPVCKKSVISQQGMLATWQQRAREVADHPMPSDIQRIVDIICNDCEVKSSNRQWHVLGIQCPSCSSFNTVIEQISDTTATT